MAAAWASAQDVIDTTGVSATEQQLTQAQAAVEVACGRIYLDSGRVRARDLYWLGRAVAYQAAWIAGQYGLETRLDATQIQHDGITTTLKDDGLTLAPMTSKALRRVSWMRSRTVHVRAPIEGFGLVGNVLREANDDYEPWQPMREAGA